MISNEIAVMASPSHPSNLELQALSVLWHEGPSTVAAVLDALPDHKNRAYTTVLSVMQGLEHKHLVKRVLVGRAHVYAAACSQQVIVQRAAHNFITNAFGGRLGEAILAILSVGTLMPDEKTNIERELQRHQTMPAKKTTSVKKAVKKVATKAPTKKVAKKAVKAPAKKVAKKAAKTVVTKVAKKAPAKKAPAKKAPAKKVAKKAAKKA